MTPNLLDAIVAGAKRAAEERERVVPRADLERRVPASFVGRDRFQHALRTGAMPVIAECKRRSPSRGVLRSEYDPAAIAASYAGAGAAAISVLTEPSFFDGSLDHLARVRAAVTIPILRKDFVVGEYQLLEAAALQADAALLIVAALEPRVLDRLVAFAEAIGLGTLVEAHDADEIARALDAGASVVGVNSRNLRTLEVQPSRLDELGPSIPSSVIAVAESGLKTAADLVRLQTIRYEAFLIGERFMTESDPGHALRDLRQAALAGVAS